MADLTIAVKWTKPGALGPGEAATGLALTDISIDLVQQPRSGGVGTLVLSGVNPTEEQPNVGVYTRNYALADLDQYNYFAYAWYTGATTLDQYYIGGAIGRDDIPLGTAIEWPYIVYKNGTLDPVEGVRVEVFVTAGMTGHPVRVGYTDVFGQPRDVYNHLLRLDPSPNPYYIRRSKPGHEFNNPDVEYVT